MLAFLGLVFAIFGAYLAYVAYALIRAHPTGQIGVRRGGTSSLHLAEALSPLMASASPAEFADEVRKYIDTLQSFGIRPESPHPLFKTLVRITRDAFQSARDAEDDYARSKLYERTQIMDFLRRHVSDIEAALAREVRNDPTKYPNGVVFAVSRDVPRLLRGSGFGALSVVLFFLSFLCFANSPR